MTGCLAMMPGGEDCGATAAWIGLYGPRYLARHERCEAHPPDETLFWRVVRLPVQVPLFPWEAT